MIHTLEQQQKGQELMKTLVTKAWENDTFKNQLVKSPIATIQEIAGENFVVPKGKRLVVQDQTDASIIYINIPAKPDYDELELTDEQLEMVAGGEVLMFAGGVAAGIAVCWVVSKLL